MHNEDNKPQMQNNGKIFSATELEKIILLKCLSFMKQSDSM